MDESRIPILVGCGQITQREDDPNEALSPIDLTAKACFEAAKDTGLGELFFENSDQYFFSPKNSSFVFPHNKLMPIWQLAKRTFQYPET